MIKMKICYLARFKDKKYPSNTIREALLKLGHKVQAVEEEEFPMKVLIDAGERNDLFLFHDGGVKTEGELDFHLSVTRLQQLLDQMRCKKSFWFLHKIWAFNERWLTDIEPFIDAGFLNDETFYRRIHAEKLFPLHCGAEEKNGQFKKELACDIAYVGSIYGLREKFLNMTRQQYGNRFKIFPSISDEDYADLCQSSKIMIVPKFPFTDFYWGDNIYRILGAGGFCLHPRLQGLKDEGFEEGNHYLGYSDWQEVLFALKNFLKPEAQDARLGIAQEGKGFVLKNCSYEKRLKELIGKIK